MGQQGRGQGRTFPLTRGAPDSSNQPRAPQAQNPISAPAIIAEVLISILMQTIGGDDG